MKKLRSVLTLFLMASLVLSLCACGGSSGGSETAADSAAVESAAVESAVADSTAEKETSGAEKTESAVDSKASKEKTESTAPAEGSEASKPEESAPAVEFPVEGKYNAFAIENEGYILAMEEAEGDSEITLEADGTGKISFDGDEEEIKSWTNENGEGTFTLSDDSSAKVVYSNGIIVLDIYGDGSMLLYYAQEGADISGINIMTREQYEALMTPDSKLYAFKQSIDPAAGVHLNYGEKTESLDLDVVYDVHEKNGMYYSVYTRAGSSEPYVVLCLDRKVYSLNAAEMTATKITEISDSSSAETILRLSSLYTLIDTYARKLEYTTEKRDLEGITYDVEVFPETDDYAEGVFYFDEDGKLVYATKEAFTYGSTEIGETIYKVNAIDDAVDESKFDLSGYEIKE